MKISISIIIPYFNLDKPLLMRAVQSIRAIGDHALWELIVIDDGTPSSEAGKWLEELHDDRIHYFYQSNRGVSEARNYGLTLARYEYILFVDADDYLFRSPLLACVRLLEREKPDMLAFNQTDVTDTGYHDRPTEKLHIRFRGRGYDYMLRYNLHGSPWSFFFRRDILGDIRFTPDIYHEDEEFVARLYLNPQKLVVTTSVVYAYYQREGSRMHQPSEKEIEKRYEDFITVMKRLQSLLPNLDSQKRKALSRRINVLNADLLYRLLNEQRSVRFARRILRMMKTEGFYPLCARFYGLPYLCILLSTCVPFLFYITRTLLRGKNLIKNLLFSRNDN